MTATSQQAVHKYVQIRFSRETGVHAFYRELLLWAGRLAQYPDLYSFKRRLLNRLLTEYRNHLTLYQGISAEHSLIDDIVHQARQYEKILATMGPGHGPPSSPTITTCRPENRAECSAQRSHTQPLRVQAGGTGANSSLAGQHPAQNPPPRE